MNLIFVSLKNLKKDELNFSGLKKLMKYGFHFLQDCKWSKKMNFIFFFVNLKKSQEREFNFLQVSKRSKKMNWIISSLKKLRKHECHLLQPRKRFKSSKSINWIVCKFKTDQKACIELFSSSNKIKILHLIFYKVTKSSTKKMHLFFFQP